MRLVLLTMVKNESRIIRRLMDSVKGRVDAIIIADTGSTDNTVELVNKYLEENKIEGAVYEFPFVNFGKSRTKSFHCFQDWLSKSEQKEKGWDASKSWALLLDGDMMLSEPLSREALSRLGPEIAGVSLRQANGSLIYSNMRVLRGSEPWECHGATHEAWCCPPGRNTILFETPVLTDHGDGGCKADKYPRDVRLLLEDLQEKPDDARTHFYLGQTYLCMREWEKAAEVLKRRIELGSWDEENYMARIYLGECYENLRREADAVKVWMDAWQYRQHRTEALMRLVNFYRKKPASQAIALMFLDKVFQMTLGEQINGYPAKKLANNDLLFVNKRNFDYHMWEELSILGFYSDMKKETFLRLDWYDLNNKLGWHEANGIFGYLHWYDWCLKPKVSARFNLPLEALPWSGEDQAKCWQAFNPSLRAKPGSGYLLNLRYANYWTSEAKWYHYRGFNGQVLTRNVLCEYSPFTQEGEKTANDFWNNPNSIKEIKIDEKYKHRDGESVKGIEDCRLVQGSDALEYFGTSKSYSPNGINKIFHVEQKSGDAGEAWDISLLPLPSCTNDGECQKNWLPFMYKGEMMYIYSFSPLRICDKSGMIRSFTPTDNGVKGVNMLKDYRGSAGPVEWKSDKYPDEAYLCVMHKVHHGGDGRRYYHRFMTLTGSLKPSRVSCFVRMTKERVEYWSGMTKAIEEGTDGYWITYGLKDSEAGIALLGTGEIEELLMYNATVSEPSLTPSFIDRLNVIKKY